MAVTRQLGLLKEGYSKARDNLRAEQSVSEQRVSTWLRVRSPNTVFVVSCWVFNRSLSATCSTHTHPPLVGIHYGGITSFEKPRFLLALRTQPLLAYCRIGLRTLSDKIDPNEHKYYFVRPWRRLEPPIAA